jgi:hypothetical protein
MSALSIPEAPAAEADDWARALLRAAGPETRSDVSTPYDVPALFEEATRAATDLTLRLPDERAPRELHVEMRLPRGLLLRSAAGWRTFVSYIDLYAAHALVAAPRALRERVGALRTAIVAVQRRPEGRP